MKPPKCIKCGRSMKEMIDEDEVLKERNAASNWTMYSCKRCHTLSMEKKER